MSDRITIENVRESERSVNRRMRNYGSRIRYVASRRYDYIAIDRFKLVDDLNAQLVGSFTNGAGEIAYERGHQINGPIIAGTKKEIHTFYRAMMVALDDAEDKA